MRLFSLLLVLAMSQYANSAGNKGGSSGGSKGFYLTAGLGFSPSSSFGNGTLIPDRAMTSVDADLFLGYHFKQFGFGFIYDYSLVSQAADPDSVSSQNTSGKASSTGFRVSLLGGKWSGGLSYYLKSTYHLDLPTNAGNSSQYTGQNGYDIFLTYTVRNYTALYLKYSIENYKKGLDGSTELNFNPDVKFSRISIGLNFGPWKKAGKK